MVEIQYASCADSLAHVSRWRKVPPLRGLCKGKFAVLWWQKVNKYKARRVVA